MSTDRFVKGALAINTFAGPIYSENANTRAMVQITARSLHVQLTMDEWIDLVCFLRNLDRTGNGIMSVDVNEFE